MSAVISKQIDLFSKQKLLHTSSFGKIFARFEGSANFSVAVETDTAAVELKLGKEAELKIDDFLFGSGGAFTFSGDDCKFSLGNDYVNVSFNPLSLSGVTIIIPAKVSAIKLESAIPALGLKGTASIDIEFIITYLPDYKKLRKVVNKNNIRAVIQIAKDQLTKSISKSKSVVRLALKYGRAALNAPLKMIGNSIGRRLAIDSIKLGSQTAALKKLIGLGGRLLGVAGIIIDTRLSVKASVPGVIAYQHKQVWKIIIPEFANAYAEFLAAMTDPKAPLTDKYFDLKIKIKRPLANVPDLYAVAETLSRTGQVTHPSVNASDWVKEYSKNPITSSYEDYLASIEWQDLFRQAYNLYILFMDAAMYSSDDSSKSVAWKVIREIAHPLLKTAGLVAAYQDILVYVLTSSLYVTQSTGIPPADIWEDWKNVRDFHLNVFDPDISKRVGHYVTLIDHESLEIKIPPFIDYS